MHRRFLTYLIDPLTREPLCLKNACMQGDFVESGELRSPTHAYPIVRGVPRFAGYHEDHYASSFGYQWNRWSHLQFESENVGGSMQGCTRRMWERIIGRNGEAPDQTLLDVGCGPGRFIDVARSKGAAVIGVDYSQAVEAAADHFRGDPDVCICQADALRLPIRTASIDGAFSIGVLHHTPSPFTGVQEIVRTVKAGGWAAVSVYAKGGYYDFPTVRLWRRFFQSLWPLFRHYPPLVYSYATVYGLRPIASVPLIGKAVRVVLPFVPLPDIRWSVLDTFDSLTPSYQSAHTSDEVRGWFEQCGLKAIEASDWGPTAYRGVKHEAAVC